MSTNKTLQRELELTGITPDNPFHTTLFGWQFLLVGLDASERIVYRHPLRKEAMTSGENLNPYIAIHDYDSKGHPRTTSHRPSAQDFVSPKYFQLISDGLGRVHSLDNGTHTVADWYLLGIDGNDPLDTAAFAGTAPEGEQGNGRYGIGAVLNDTARADMTNTGRMWLHWQGDPISVSASSALPFLFTRQDDGSLRLVHTHWDRETNWDSVNKKSLITEAGSTALLAFDLNQLFDGDVRKSDLPAVLRSYGDELVRRAMELDHAAGIDSQHPVSPLAELPSNYTDLLPPREEGNLLDGFVPSGDNVTVHDTYVVSGDGNGVYANHAEGFIWPADGRGVKLTVNLRTRPVEHFIWGMIFKLAKADSTFSSAPSTLRIQNFAENPELCSIGTYDGTYGIYPNEHHHRTLHDKHTIMPFDSVYYDTYEVYFYPDGQAYVYRNDRYAGALVIPEFLRTPGDRFTIGAYFLQGYFYFRDLKVEAFDVPASYVPAQVSPMITGVDLSGTHRSNYDPAVLLGSDTSTDSGAILLQATNSVYDHIEFNVTAPGKLSVFLRPDYRCTWELRRLTPTGSNEPFDPANPLDPVNLSAFMTGEMPVNDWYTFPFVLPSGRYYLHARELVEDSNYTYLRRWRIDPVDSDQPMLVDTWPLGATFEGNDIASTLNSEQLEFEADVNGVHLHNEEDSFSFVVTYDAKLRIHPHTNAGRVRLHRVDGKDLSLETDQLVSGQWYEFPYRIPAGKYQLSGIGSEYTTLTAWEALAPGDLPVAPDLPVTFSDIDAKTYNYSGYQNGDAAVALLTDGQTHYDGPTHSVILRSTFFIEFDVTEESMLTVHTTGNVGPNGNYGRVALYRVHGQNLEHVHTSPGVRKYNWYAFPTPLEPGRYRLRGIYSSEDAQLTEWHLSPANQLQLPSAPVIYDIDGKDTTWAESATNAHVVLTDGDASGWGGDHGVSLDNEGGTDFLRFRLSKPADVLITPSVNAAYMGPITLRHVNPEGSVTDVATLLLKDAGEPHRFSHQLKPGKYMIYGHGHGNIGNVVINQLAVEDGQYLPELPAKARATLTSTNTAYSAGDTEALLTDLLTPSSSYTSASNSVFLNYDDYVEFVLDSTAVMSLFVSKNANGVRLYRVAGTGETLTEEPVYTYQAPLGDWSHLPFNLEAGTYRLYGFSVNGGNGTVLSEWAFSLPRPDYSTTPPPSIMEVDASSVQNFSVNTDRDLINDNTYYDPVTPNDRCAILKAAELDVDGNEIAPAQNVVWFTLTQDAELSLFSAGGGNDPVQLLSEDGVTVDLTTGPLTDEDWTSFGQTIPAGRYQLIGQGTTIITEIKAEAPAPAV